MSPVHCIKCNRRFVNRAAYVAHMTTSSLHAWCQRCNRDFVDKNARKAHYENHSAHLATYCHSCEIDFNGDKSLENHQRASAKHQARYCHECKQNFDNDSLLKDHWRSTVKHQSTFDPICERLFATRGERTEHFMSDPARHFYCRKHLHFFGTAQEYESHLWNSPDHIKCVPCECGFDGQVDWERHYWISEKHPKCLTCQKGFHSSQHRQIHYWNSDRHAKCTSCRMGFEDEKGLEDHYLKSDQHADKCHSCGLGFPSETEQKIHLETAPKHIDKETCDLLHETSAESLDHNAHSPKIADLLQCSSSTAESEKHRKTSTQEEETYCDRCKIQCSDSNDFLLHKAQNPERHHLCTKWIADYETEEDLLYHCQNSEAHQTPEAHETPDTQLIEIADMDNDRLQKALVPRKKESLCCFSGCDDDRRFDSVSSVVQHLESGECTKGWTIQQVNDIAAEHPDIFNFLSVRYVPWFLAGLPRKTVEDSDLIRGKWKCSFCKSSHSSRSELEHHIMDEISDTAYPQLLRCCACLVGFKTLSALISHSEGGSGWSCSNAATIARIVSHLKTRVAENSGYPQPLHEVYELRFDPSRRDSLVVKVSMNSIKQPKWTNENLDDMAHLD